LFELALDPLVPEESVAVPALPVDPALLPVEGDELALPPLDGGVAPMPVTAEPLEPFEGLVLVDPEPLVPDVVPELSAPLDPPLPLIAVFGGHGLVPVVEPPPVLEVCAIAAGASATSAAAAAVNSRRLMSILRFAWTRVRIPACSWSAATCLSEAWIVALRPGPDRYAQCCEQSAPTAVSYTRVFPGDITGHWVKPMPRVRDLF
jgi:hypothetical protein